MLNDCSRGYLQNCCYVEQLSMALFHVSHPPVQTWGEDIPYFLIFPKHPEFWTPLQVLLLGAPCLHPLTLSRAFFLICLILLPLFFDSYFTPRLAAEQL